MKITTTIQGQVAHIEVLSFSGNEEIRSIAPKFFSMDEVDVVSFEVRPENEKTQSIRAQLKTDTKELAKVMAVLIGFAQTTTAFGFAIGYFQQKRESGEKTNKLQLVKNMKDIYDLGLKEAKDIADSAEAQVGYKND